MYASLLTEVYQRVVLDPGVSAEELANQLSMDIDDVERIVRLLHEQGLLASTSAPWATSGPRHALATLVVQAEADVARQQLRVAQLRAGMEAALAAAQAEQDRTSIVVHRERETVWERLEDLSRTAQQECLSLNPGRAHAPDVSNASKPLNQQAIERGVSIRSIYQQSFILDAGTREYVQWFEAIGGQARTRPTVDRQLVIVDRQVAILQPSARDADEVLAYEIATPTLVDLLVDWFELLWSHAARVEDATRRGSTPALEDPMATGLLALLAEGATDAQAARSLGISERTVRRLMSTVMKELGAESRLQAGVEAVRQGLV